jgi:uncharacterized short protein YbdD (DUF466 family)
MSLKSDNVEFVRYCGDRKYNGQEKDRQYNGQERDRQYNSQEKDR